MPVGVCANVSGKTTEENLNTWAPAIYVGDLNKVPGSWLPSPGHKHQLLRSLEELFGFWLRKPGATFFQSSLIRVYLTPVAFTKPPKFDPNKIRVMYLQCTSGELGATTALAPCVCLQRRWVMTSPRPQVITRRACRSG